MDFRRSGLNHSVRLVPLFFLFACAIPTSPSGEETSEIPLQIRRWFAIQAWQRDTEGPVISLGESGKFDDMHIFAPAVIHEGNKYLLWYSGSGGSLANRVFRLGLATSEDGRSFAKHPGSPVLGFKNETSSVLTPALLRTPDGNVLRENGKIRMWFSSTWLGTSEPLYTLHETKSGDGVTWENHSDSLMAHVYSPTIIKTGDLYQMWYVDVQREPWVIAYSESRDGTHWQPGQTVIQLDQKWEMTRMLYPTVLKVDSVYLMWYGSYWKDRDQTTALGFAASMDGKQWYKHPENPVFKPDTSRAWESHYVTSQSVLRLADGSFRIWYASRKAPPFVNKYFAIGTAAWVPTLIPDSLLMSKAPVEDTTTQLPRDPEDTTTQLPEEPPPTPMDPPALLNPAGTAVVQPRRLAFSLAGHGLLFAADGRYRGVSLYTPQGRLLKTIRVNQENVVWDGVDLSGNPVRKGVYFARVDGGSKSLVFRFALY